MNPLSDTTIVAVSTPAGCGGIAVIRLSGPEAFAIADKVWRGRPLSTAVSHTAHLGDVIDADGAVLDTAVATVYRAPGSFTGEDTVELSVHGSPWIQRAAVNLLIDAGATPAAAGEFTKRAFINGRLDLAQAEGVADMIAASSRASARIAARQMKGELSGRLNTLRDRMIELASLLELELDFSEEDVEFADRRKLRLLAEETLQEVKRLAGTFRAGRALREGVAVAIAGAPNAGKSTLLNALLGEEKSIVTDIAGTTRDVIEDTMELDGTLIRFIDTAGLRHTDDPVEKIGIRRAVERIAHADIVLMLRDATAPDAGTDLTVADILGNASAESQDLREMESEGSSPAIIHINTKADLLSNESLCKPQRDVEAAEEGASVWISARTGEGMDKLLEQLKALSPKMDIADELPVVNARHYENLQKTSESLSAFLEAMESGLPGDLLAEEIRQATHHLGEITGAITTDTLLQTLFSRFCIGK